MHAAWSIEFLTAGTRIRSADDREKALAAGTDLGATTQKNRVVSPLPLEK